jgi:hypothetical protein
MLRQLVPAQPKNNLGYLPYFHISISNITILPMLNIRKRGWDVTQWYSTCLACPRPWVQSHHQKTKTKKKKKKKEEQYNA